MSPDWTAVIADNLPDILADKSEPAKELVALFELVTEYDNGGLTQYLMNDSGDNLGVIRRIFDRRGFLRGNEIITSLERKLGLAVPASRSERGTVIEAMAGYSAGVDPFDDEHKAFGQIRRDVDAIAEKLVDFWLANRK